MTLLRVELLSTEAELCITHDDRVYKVVGGDHLNLEMKKVGEKLEIKLTLAAPDADKYRGVPINTEPDFPVRPPSARPGVSIVMADGREYYRGPPITLPKI
jgi:hypothetical protein